MLEAFTFEKIAEMDDGRITMLLNKLMREAAMDCNDRPGEPKPRSVTLKINYKPILNPTTGGCDEVMVDMEVAPKAPARITKAFSMRPRQNGTLLFNHDSPDAYDQRTIQDEIKKNQQNRGEKPKDAE